MNFGTQTIRTLLQSGSKFCCLVFVVLSCQQLLVFIGSIDSFSYFSLVTFSHHLFYPFCPPILPCSFTLSLQSSHLPAVLMSSLPVSFSLPVLLSPSRLLRYTECHCSDNYLLTCLCHHHPCLSVGAICAQLGARLPVLFCPAREGENHTWGHRSETPTQTYTYCLILRSSFLDTQTRTHTFCWQIPLPFLLPLGLGGVSWDERHTAVATTVPSVLSCSVCFVLFCQHYIQRKRVVAGVVLPWQSYLEDT